MKIKGSILFLIFQFSVAFTYALNFNPTAADTLTFNVNGNSTCKTQIEGSVSGLTGISSASWDTVTKNITIIYDQAVVAIEVIAATIAENGYDNDYLRAKQDDYSALTAECQYIRGEEED